MIRGLFLLLLLANIGVFAWYRLYVAPGNTQLQPSPPPGGQPLQLMSELNAAQRKALASANAAAPPASTKAAFGSTTLTPPNTLAMGTTLVPGSSTATVPANAQSCVSYGPFPNADAAGQGMTRLKTAGLNPSQRAVPGKAKLGYWVYLPPFGSRHEADAAADLLKKKGVTDIYVVADEANRNAVSLGVFSQKDGAIEREKDIRKLGFKTQMSERFRDEPRYWLDAKGADSALPGADGFKDLGEETAPIVRATTACAG